METQAFRYRVLCSVSFEHPGFKGIPLDRWISVTPASNTQDFMDKNGLKMQLGQDSLFLYCRTKITAGQEKRPFFTIKGTQLDFIFKLIDPVNSALPKRDSKHYVFGNKKAFDGGQAADVLFLPPVNAPATIADEIVKDGADFKLAFADFGNTANPPPLGLKIIDSGDYASTTNLELLPSPDQFPIKQQDTGLIRILIDDLNALGNSYKLLLVNGDISSKTYRISIKSKPG